MSVSKPEYERVVEYAKHRSWLVGQDRYDVVPRPDRVVWKKNGEVITYDELPPLVKDFLNRRAAEIAPLLAH
jgi:hypothetical protein